MQLDVSDPKGYNIASALRGPDEDMPTTKYVLTGRVRALCGVTNFLVVTRHEKVDTDHVYTMLKELQSADTREAVRHYLNHVDQSAWELGAFALARLARDLHQRVSRGQYPASDSDIQEMLTLANDGISDG